MTGCYTCGGGMGKHDPVAHDWTDEPDDLADAIVRTMHVVPPSAGEVRIATGFTLAPTPTDEQ